MAPGSNTGWLFPQVRVELALNLPTTDPTAFVLDDPARGLLDGVNTLTAGLQWTDVSSWVKSFEVNRSSQRVAGPVTRYEAGTATIRLRNDDRRFDPLNLAGPYVVAGATQVRPMRPIRVTAIFRGSEFRLFTGYVDEWLDDSVSPITSTVTVTATDAFKVLANDRGEKTAVLGAGETSGSRVHRILNGLGWPTAGRLVATGDVTVQGTTLSGDALAELQLVADTEAGDLFVDPDGLVVFRNRRSYSTEPASAQSQVIFGSAGPAAGELYYSDVARAYDDDLLINQAAIARAGGVQQVASDDASISEYLLHAYARDDLAFATDDDALAYARFLISGFKTPDYRFTELTLDPRADPGNLFPQALGRRFGDRITVRRRPPGGYTTASSSRHWGSQPSPGGITIAASEAGEWTVGDLVLVYQADDATIRDPATATVLSISAPAFGFVNLITDHPIAGLVDTDIAHKVTHTLVERSAWIRGVKHVMTEQKQWTTTWQLQAIADLGAGPGGTGGGGTPSVLILDDPINGFLDLNILGAGGASSGGGAGSPTLAVTATPGDGYVDLSWAVTNLPAGVTVSGFTDGRDGVDTTGFGAFSTSDPASATGRRFDKLINGSLYTFTVTAALSSGGPLGPITATATPGQVVQGPQPTALGLTATAGDTVIDLAWQVTNLPAGVTVTGYTASRDGSDSTGFGAYTSPTLPASTSTLRFDRLINGATYNVTVVATLSTGATLTASKAATPDVTAPGGGGGTTTGGTSGGAGWTIGAKSNLGFNSLVFNTNETTEAIQFGAIRGRAVDGMLWFLARGSWAELDALWSTDKAKFLADGYILVSTMPHAPESEGSSMNSIGANNGYASQQRAWAAARAAEGFNSPRHVIRIDWEANGNWYNWNAGNSGGAAALKAAIQNFVINVRAGGLTQVKFELCGNKGPSQTSDMTAYDPGPAYIDILTVDAYDHFSASFSSGQWTTEINKSPGLQTVRNNAVASGRLWGHSEGGNVHSADGGNDNPFYWQSLWAFIQANLASMAYHVTYDNEGAPSSLQHQFTNLNAGSATLAGVNPSSYAYYRQKWGGG